MSLCKKCSHCGGKGHNSSTCCDRVSVKLFGVCISPTCGSMAAMRKSASTGNLVDPAPSACIVQQDGYVSDDLVQATSNTQNRKKGVPWTEEEHKLFLLALQKLGKGDWRGISRNFVKTRTPTQVASHAQKYFIRQSNLNKRRRRSSLFDMTPDTVPLYPTEEIPCEENVEEKSSPFKTCLADGFADSLASTKLAVSHNECCETKNSIVSEPMNGMLRPSVFPAYVQFTGFGNLDGVDPSLLFCHPLAIRGLCHPSGFESKIVKPIPVAPNRRLNLDASPKSLELNTSKTGSVIGRTVLSPELSESESRHSAFRALSVAKNPPSSNQGHTREVISVA